MDFLITRFLPPYHTLNGCPPNWTPRGTLSRGLLSAAMKWVSVVPENFIGSDSTGPIECGALAPKTPFLRQHRGPLLIPVASRDPPQQIPGG